MNYLRNPGGKRKNWSTHIMNKLFWIAAGASLGIGAYIILNGSNEYTYNTGSAADDLDDASDDLSRGARRFSRKASNWGTGQRVSGTVGQVGGRVKEGVGNLAGSDDLAAEGIGDQVVGTVKDAAGQAAHAVSNAVDNITK